MNRSRTVRPVDELKRRKVEIVDNLLLLSWSQYPINTPGVLKYKIFCESSLELVYMVRDTFRNNFFFFLSFSIGGESEIKRCRSFTLIYVSGLFNHNKLLNYTFGNTFLFYKIETRFRVVESNYLIHTS